MSRLSIRCEVVDGGELGRDRAADLLGRRVGRAQLGELLLELLEPPQPQVEVGVGRASGRRARSSASGRPRSPRTRASVLVAGLGSGRLAGLGHAHILPCATDTPLRPDVAGRHGVRDPVQTVRFGSECIRRATSVRDETKPFRFIQVNAGADPMTPQTETATAPPARRGRARGGDPRRHPRGARRGRLRPAHHGRRRRRGPRPPRPPSTAAGTARSALVIDAILHDQGGHSRPPGPTPAPCAAT